MNISKKILLVFMCLSFLSCSFISGNKLGHKGLLLNDKKMFFLKLQSTSISNIQKQYGGEIQNKVDEMNDHYDYICLKLNSDNPLLRDYFLTLISGANGGWDTITEYEIIEKGKIDNPNLCGFYPVQFSSIWIGKTKDYVIHKYGEPTKSNDTLIKYEFEYIQSSSQIYSGIIFYLDIHGRINGMNVFETKENLNYR